jgi:Domain of unknown function (DUF397)
MTAVDQSKAVWRKSTRSTDNGGACVEVADLSDGGAAVRDSKDNGNGPILVFAAPEWESFLGGIKDGEFDRR